MIVEVHFFDKAKGWQPINNVVYPIKFSNRLDLEFDSGSFNSLRVKDETVLPAFSMVRIGIGESENDMQYKYYYATASRQWTPAFEQLCWRLVEPSKELQGQFLDGLAVTQPRKGTQKKLVEVAERLLCVTPLRKNGQEQRYSLSEDAKKYLTDNSPEFRWSAQTSLWEALCDIGAYIDAIPRLTWDENKERMGLIAFDNVNKMTDVIDNDEIAFNSMLVDVDEEKFCSALESNVSNIASRSSTSDIWHPSDKVFVTPRTEEIKLTDKNCRIFTDKPIAELTGIYMQMPDELIVNAIEVIKGTDGEYRSNGSLTLELSKVLKALDRDTDLLDLTSHVFEYAEWKTLPVAADPTAAQSGTCYKDNTFYYERYGKSIVLMNEDYKYPGYILTDFGWKNIVQSYFAADLKQYIHDNIGTSGTIDEELQGKTVKLDNKEYVLQRRNGNIVDFQSDNLMRTKFRVKYNALNPNIKLRVSKQTQQNLDFVQQYNQRAEIADAEHMGRNMQSVVNRMGVETVCLTTFETSFSNIKKVGQGYKFNGKNYVITAVEHNIVSAEGIECVYYLSENWNYISQWYNIDKKFRSWNIPAETVRRNLFYRDICKISTKATENGVKTHSVTDAGIECFLSSFSQKQAKNGKVNNMWLRAYDADDEKGSPVQLQVVDAAAFAFGNSLVFHGEMRDNLSAGIKSDEGVDFRYNIDSYYCKEDGTGYLCDIFFGVFAAEGKEIALPDSGESEMTKGNYNYFSLGSLEVQKDPAEVLSLTYQIDFCADDGIVIGNAFTEKNQLVRAIDDRKFYFKNCTGINAISDENGQIKLEILHVKGAWEIRDKDENGDLYLAGTDNQKNLYLSFASANGGGAETAKEVTITYEFESPGRKGNKTHKKNYFENQSVSVQKDIDEFGIPQHFYQDSVEVNGEPVSGTVKAAADMVIKVKLEFEKFDAIFEPKNKPIEVTAKNSASGLYGYYSEEIKPKDDAETALFKFRSGVKTVVKLTKDAVIYVTNGSTKNAFFEFGFGNQFELASEDGSVTGKVKQNSDFPMVSGAEYRIYIDGGNLSFHIYPFGTIIDTNSGNTWRFDYAEFNISEIIQRIDREEEL